MSNRLPQITFIYDRYKKASPTRKASVELRITYNYKQRYISTGIMLYPNQWRKGRIVNSPDAFQLNQVIDNLLMEVKGVLFEMQQRGSVDIMNIAAALDRKRTGNISFLDFCHKRTEIRKYGKSAIRQRRYDYFLSVLNTWGVIKNFEDVTENNIILFDAYLKKKNLRVYTKWHNYHMFLNSFISDAIEAGYLKRNPYSFVNIAREKEASRIDKYLTPDEFTAIKKAKLPTKSLERVRDLFVFQTYTCLSYSDLQDFDVTKIEKIKGVNTYINKRHKTKKLFTVPLLPTAQKILKKYDYNLPIISNVKYNEYLKVVAQAAKIDKPISSHWARHTGATLLLNEGVDMRVVSKICGHTSIKITEQVYAKLLDETIVEAMKDIKDI